MVKEVEMKAWLSSDTQVRQVITFLKKAGKYLKKVVKEDTYFALPKTDHFDFRLREADGQYWVNRKKRRLIGNLEENDELEFSISDPAAFLKLVKKLGYVIFLKKTKWSQVYDLGNWGTGEVTFVSDLGPFLEVEILCKHEHGIPRARKRIEDIFQALKLMDQIESRQYSVLLRI